MPLLPLGYPHHWERAVGHGDTQGQASFRPKTERTKWLYWGGNNHLGSLPLPLPLPRPVPATYILSMS